MPFDLEICKLIIHMPPVT